MDNSNLPDQTIILFEQIHLDEGNYAGNFRFCFTNHGGFYHNTNDEFMPTNDHNWDTDFSDNPTIQLNKESNQAVQNAINQSNINDLAHTYPMTGQVGNYFERWTFFDGKEQVQQITVWNDERPEALRQLKSRLDEILESN